LKKQAPKGKNYIQPDVSQSHFINCANKVNPFKTYSEITDTEDFICCQKFSSSIKLSRNVISSSDVMNLKNCFIPFGIWIWEEGDGCDDRQRNEHERHERE
jgi:hypothetical protein